MRKLFPLLLLVAIAGASSSVVDADKRDDAFEHVSAGDAHKKRAEELKKAERDRLAEQRFLDAAVEYQAAYDLVPHPLMLYNLAQVYRYAGDEIQALAFYQEFLDTDPSGPAAVASAKYAAILRKRLESAESDPGDKDPDNKDPLDGQDSEIDPDEKDPDTEDSIDPDIALIGGGTDSSKGGGALRYSGLAAVALGAVAVGFGVKFGLDTKNTEQYLSDYPEDAWTDSALALQAEGESSEKKAVLFSAIGGVAIVAGGIMYYLSGRNDQEDQQATLQVSPTVGGDQVGVSFGGHF